MGETFATIVSNGLLEAGNTSLTTYAKSKLKSWLRSQAASFLWPMCKGEVTNLALAVDAQKVSLGNGSGGVTEEIIRVMDPMKLWSSDYTVRQDVRVQTDWATGFVVDNVSTKAADNKGVPSYAKVKTTTTKGRWDVIFDKVADRALLLNIQYQFTPVDPADNAVPWYPNDETMVAAVVYHAMIHQWGKDSNEAQSAHKDLIGMQQADRLKYGVQAGQNEVVGLDTRVFK